MRHWLSILVVAGLAHGAAADDSDYADSREPRRFWLGSTSGLGMAVHAGMGEFAVDEYDPAFLTGIDLGFQRINKGSAFSIDANLLPVGDVYRARGAVILGHSFTTKYSLPCAAPAGYACSEVYNFRHVRSIFGLKLGAELGTAPGGETTAVEVGFAFRSQISFDISFMYDPAHDAPGGAMDFTWQLGPFYWGMELRGLASRDEPQPLLMTMTLGYTPRMWKSNER